MGSVRVKVEGIPAFQKAIRDKAKMEAVKKVVKLNGSELQQTAMRNCNFKGHYEGKKFIPPTGALKRSIMLSFEDQGKTAVIEPKVHYAGYVEFGTRFMEAQPYLRPAYNRQVQIFKEDLRKLGLE